MNEAKLLIFGLLSTL